MRQKVRQLAVPSLIARIMRTGQAECLTDVSEKIAGVHSVIAVPIIIDQKTIGVLLVGSGAPSVRRYDQRDVTVLTECTNRLAVTLQNSRLYKEAGDAVRARDEFISIASHELLAPLTSLDLRLQMLRRAKDISAATLESIGRCQQDSKRLAMLVDELLDLSRIQIGRMELQRREFDLAELTRQVVSRFEPELQDKHIALTLDLSPLFGVWDSSRMDRVLTNLLSNAIKYGDGKPIEITVGSRADFAELMIRDHGIGIAPEQQGRIFERFQRVVSGTKVVGLGLGLYVAKQLVSAHGGVIRVESEPGKGSTFTVELPRGNYSSSAISKVSA